VLRVPDRDPRLLRYLGEIGLVPDADVHVLRREPLDGPLHILSGDSPIQHVIGRDIAESVSVCQ
jgi:Fe2+ transport system protein FeoA